VLVCLNKPSLLTANTTATAFLWSTGSTSPSIEVNTPGTYWVRVTNTAGCVASDSLLSNWDDCESFIPSAFSPNGDGLNDYFGLTNGMNSTIYSFYIYNRYGQLVFTSKDSFEKWDGRVKGKPGPTGTYVWMMTYKNKAGFIQTDKGTLMLIR
jgi:gliding motility-associated-like protein